MTSDIADDTTQHAQQAQRRRGAALEVAIREAAYDELTEAGYAAFSVESVAARARTGKASIYRRWPSKQELVMDALTTHLSGPDEGHLHTAFGFDDSTTTADALRAVGTMIIDTLTSPVGRALRAVKLEAAADAELAALVDRQFQYPRRMAMLNLLRRGVERGEVRPEAATALVADVLPAVLTHRVLMQGEEVSPADVAAVIEQVMIPLVSTAASSNGVSDAR